MIRERDMVVLSRDLVDLGLKAGDVGTVVLIHQDEAGYEVEFATLTSETLAVVTLPAAAVRPIGPREIAHARAVAYDDSGPAQVRSSHLAGFAQNGTPTSTTSCRGVRFVHIDRAARSLKHQPDWLMPSSPTARSVRRRPTSSRCSTMPPLTGRKDLASSTPD